MISFAAQSTVRGKDGAIREELLQMYEVELYFITILNMVTRLIACLSSIAG